MNLHQIIKNLTEGGRPPLQNVFRSDQWAARADHCASARGLLEEWHKSAVGDPALAFCFISK